MSLHLYEDLAEAEIGRVLGLRLGTVKSQLHRGLARLRKELRTMKDRAKNADLEAALRSADRAVAGATVADLPASTSTGPGGRSTSMTPVW
jgi:hypothetical protein